jgi:hypothetical protein
MNGRWRCVAAGAGAGAGAGAAMGGGDGGWDDGWGVEAGSVDCGGGESDVNRRFLSPPLRLFLGGNRKYFLEKYSNLLFLYYYHRRAHRKHDYFCSRYMCTVTVE